MLKREFTAEDIERYNIKQGRGYDKTDTEVFRQTALHVVRALEDKLQRALAEVSAQRSPAAEPDIQDIAKSLSHEELERAGLVAIGLELADARVEANRRKQQAMHHAYRILADVRSHLERAAQALETGASPPLTTHQLRIKIGQAITALGLPDTPTAPAKSTTAPSRAANVRERFYQ